MCHHHWNSTIAQTVFLLDDNLLKCAVPSLGRQHLYHIRNTPACPSHEIWFQKPTPVSLVCGRKIKTSSDSNAFQLVGNSTEHFVASVHVLIHK